MLKWLPALLLVCSPVFGQGFVNVVRDTAAAPSISDCDDVTGLHAWWDATAGITEDVGVTTWADQKNSYDWVQTTDASQPALTSSCQNSLDCVEFDATNDFMTQAGAAEFIDTANNDITVVIVSNNKDNGGNEYFFVSDGDSVDRIWWRQSSDKLNCAVGGSIKACSGDISANTTYIAAWRYNTTTELLESFINGVITPFNSWAGTAGTAVEDGTAYLGTSAGAADFQNKQIMEVCIFLDDISNGDLDDLMDALNTKWSVF